MLLFGNIISSYRHYMSLYVRQKVKYISLYYKQKKCYSVQMLKMKLPY